MNWKVWVGAAIMVSLMCVLAACNSEQPTKQTTEQLAATAGQSVARAQDWANKADTTVQAMTPGNLPQTKPQAHAELGGVKSNLTEAQKGIKATQKAAAADAKTIAEAKISDPVKSMIGWIAVAGIAAGVGCIVASFFLSVVFLRSLGAALLAAGIVATWIYEMFATIMAVLTWGIVGCVVAFVAYLAFQHGNLADGGWAVFATVQTFFQGLWSDVKGIAVTVKALFTGKTGETTLVPPKPPQTPQQPDKTTP